MQCKKDYIDHIDYKDWCRVFTKEYLTQSKMIKEAQ